MEPLIFYSNLSRGCFRGNDGRWSESLPLTPLRSPERSPRGRPATENTGSKRYARSQCALLSVVSRCSVILFRMRPNLLAASALVLAAMSPFVSAQATKSVASRVAAQNALFDEVWQANLKVNPTQATAVGDYRYNDQLGDYSLAAAAARHQRDPSDLARIKAIDPPPDFQSRTLDLPRPFPPPASRARRRLRPQRV